MVKEQHSTNDDWKQWQAEFVPEPQELWTRAEILEAADRLGVRRPDGHPVDDRTLRFWEENGIIPRGTEGKIAGRNYTYRLYPWWVVDLLHQVCRYQAAHVKLEDLPARMRIEARYLSIGVLWSRPKDPQAYAGNSLGSFALRMLREPTLPPFERQVAVGSGDAGRDLRAALRALASSWQWVGLGGAVRARIEFFDAEDKEIATYDADLREYQLTPEQQESFERLKRDTASWVEHLQDSGASKE